MEKIWVNRSSTQEELRKYRKCSLFNDERETTPSKFWKAKTSIACLYSRNDFYLFCLCFSAVALSLNFTHHDVFFFVQYCLFTINCVCFYYSIKCRKKLFFFNQNLFPTNNSIDKMLPLCTFHNHWCMPTQAYLLWINNFWLYTSN